MLTKDEVISNSIFDFIILYITPRSLQKKKKNNLVVFFIHYSSLSLRNELQILHCWRYTPKRPPDAVVLDPSG